MNANEVLRNIEMYIANLEDKKASPLYYGIPKLRIADVYNDLGIFDWWNEDLSLSQLKKMKKFLERSIALGFDKYVCFRVGAKGCSHGMWAYKDEAEDDHSPDGDCLFRAFRAGDNYWNAKLNGEWIHKDMTYKEIKELVLN